MDKPYTIAPCINQGLVSMSQLNFTSPNKILGYKLPTDICFGDVKEITNYRDINPGRPVNIYPENRWLKHSENRDDRGVLEFSE